MPTASMASSLRDVVVIVTVSLCIILPIRFFLIQPFSVEGLSMSPSYGHNDYLLVDQISYDFSDPKRGHVIVFRSPRERNKVYIKRIIGLPNETIILKDDSVIVVNESTAEEGKVLDEPYIQGVTHPYAKDRVIPLSEDEYFVMGDNRSNSSDSREWGVLRESHIIGKVLVRLLPVSDIFFFKRPSYTGLE